MPTKTDKPLGHAHYGSIPHLPGSRLGVGDHHCHPGQAAIATQRTRDRFDRVIVQCKLDGSNVGVARIGDNIVALGRAGYRADTSPYRQHHLFAQWVTARVGLFQALLADGERLAGEWLAQVHGTRYAARDDLFVVFDILRSHTRSCWPEVRARIEGYFPLPSQLGDTPMTPEDAMIVQGAGRHGEMDRPEGAVWRVERNVGAAKGKVDDWRVDFLVKYVRPDKVDGAYLPQITGRDTEWNGSALALEAPCPTP